MKPFRALVRQHLRANRRANRPSWSPREEPFEQLSPEVIDVAELLRRDHREDPR